MSVDLDPVDVHLRGYGHRTERPDPLVHGIALPRLLELFQRHDVRATFFVLARDEPSETRRLPEIAAAGHEVASHGIGHLTGLSRRAEAELAREVLESRSRIEAAIGRRVTGFRAPDWSAGRRLIAALGAADYRYDASLVPSPVLTAGRMLLAVRARSLADVTAVRLPPSLHRRPFRWVVDDRSIVEFPLAVSPRLRVPIYHTLRPRMDDPTFERHLDGFVRRGDSFTYALHGIDALGLTEDGVDDRLSAHPGMSLGLEAKAALLERTVAAIVARFDVATFEDRLPSNAE